MKTVGNLSPPVNTGAGKEGGVVRFSMPSNFSQPSQIKPNYPSNAESGSDIAFKKALRWMVPTAVAVLGGLIVLLSNIHITP